MIDNIKQASSIRKMPIENENNIKGFKIDNTVESVLRVLNNNLKYLYISYINDGIELNYDLQELIFSSYTLNLDFKEGIDDLRSSSFKISNDKLQEAESIQDLFPANGMKSFLKNKLIPSRIELAKNNVKKCVLELESY